MVQFDDVGSWGFSPVSIAASDTGRVAVGGRDGALFVLLPGSGNVLEAVRGQMASVGDSLGHVSQGSARAMFALAWNPEGELLFQPADQGSIVAWDGSTERLVAGGVEGGPPFGAAEEVFIRRIRELHIDDEGTIWFVSADGVGRIRDGEVEALVVRPDRVARFGGAPLDFEELAGLGVTEGGDVYFLHQTESAVHRLAAGATTVETIPISIIGVGEAPELDRPTDLAISPDGDLLIVDRHEHRIVLAATR